MLGEATPTGAAARREKNRAEMNAAILEIAHAMVVENGADALSIRGIARQLGYSPAAIYEYYDSREAILKALFFEGAGGLSETMERAITDLGDDVDPVRALLTMAKQYRIMALDNPEMYRLVLGSMKCLPDDLMQRNADGLPLGMASLVEIVMEGIEQGLMVESDPFATVMAAWSTVHGFVSLELSGHLAVMIASLQAHLPDTDDVTPESIFERCMLVVFSGMLTDAGQQLDT